MKVYNVLFESNYENEDFRSEVSTFVTLDEAKKCLDRAMFDEISDFSYDDEEVKDRLFKDPKRFTFYTDETHGTWKFRGSIIETNVETIHHENETKSEAFADEIDTELRCVQQRLETVGKDLCSVKNGGEAWSAINRALEGLRDALNSLYKICED